MRQIEKNSINHKILHFVHISIWFGTPYRCCCGGTESDTKETRDVFMKLLWLNGGKTKVHIIIRTEVWKWIISRQDFSKNKPKYVSSSKLNSNKKIYERKIKFAIFVDLHSHPLRNFNPKILQVAYDSVALDKRKNWWTGYLPWGLEREVPHYVIIQILGRSTLYKTCSSDKPS